MRWRISELNIGMMSIWNIELSRVSILGEMNDFEYFSIEDKSIIPEEYINKWGDVDGLVRNREDYNNLYKILIND